MKKTVTFGIAVYNVERFLGACIESVIAQKGEDIEIIIVDDGSTDRSGEIVDEYAAKDSRIRVFHKENGGVSTARNVMIEEAQGKWLLFIDGDDKLTVDCVERLKNYVQSDYDVVFFDSQFFRFDHSVPRYSVTAGDKVISQRRDLNNLARATIYANQDTPNYINRTIVTIWGKMYRVGFLKEKGILFDTELRKSQDVAFSLICVRSMEKCILVRQAIYAHRLNPYSIVRRYNPNIPTYNHKIAAAFWDIVNHFPTDIREEMIKRYYMSCMVIIRSALQLDFCHRNNPNTFAERKKAFEAFVKTPWCQEAINRCAVDELKKSDFAILAYITNDDFKGIEKFFRKRDFKEQIGHISHRLGLNKIRSKIRQKLHQKGGLK